MAIWYVDLEGSAGSGNGTSFANRSNALATIVNAASAGDTIRVKQTTPTSIGSATWTNNGNIVAASSLTKAIYNDGAWTAANANVVTAASTTTTLRKQGANTTVITINSAFTPGKIAYFPVGGTQDYSGYQKVSFWLRSSIAITNINIYQIRLCSDALGDVAVNTLTLPSMFIPANSFIPIVLDNAAALGSSIQSVALYAPATDPGIPTLYIDNMFATNNVSLLSLISTDSVGLPAVGSGWHSIRAITNGGDIELDVAPSSAISVVPRGYPGTTGSYTTYVSEGITNQTKQTATTTYLFNFTKAGTDGSPITISGGWNATDMSTRTGLTHVNNGNMQGRAIALSAAYQVLENFILSHTSGNTLAFGGDNQTITNVFIVANAGNSTVAVGTRTFQTMTDCYGAHGGIGLTSSSRRATWNNCIATNNASFGLSSWGAASFINNCKSVNNNDSGMYSAATDNATFSDCTLINNATGLEFGDARNLNFVHCTITSSTNYALFFANCSNINFYDITTANTGVAAIFTTTSQQFNLFSWKSSSETKVANFASYLGVAVISINNDGVADSHIIYFDDGNIQSTTAVRHSAEGIAWQMKPTNTVRTEFYPLRSNIKAIPVKANVEHTASVWVRRDNTGLSMQFGMGDQGVSGLSATAASMTALADTWEQLAITFTPLEDAVIDFYVTAYGGSTYTGYWDDFNITAASKLDVSKGDYGYEGFGVYATSYLTEEVLPPAEYRYINLA